MTSFVFAIGIYIYLTPIIITYLTCSGIYMNFEAFLIDFFYNLILPSFCYCCHNYKFFLFTKIQLIIEKTKKTLIYF